MKPLRPQDISSGALHSGGFFFFFLLLYGIPEENVYIDKNWFLYMKRLIFTLLLPVVLLCCCDKESSVAVQLSNFTDTGCGRENVTTKSWDDWNPTMTLRDTPDGLVITHYDAVLNCSIVNGGIGCDFSIEGNVVKLRTYEKDGDFLKCICPVDEMSATVTGLSIGTEYVLEYTCGSTKYVPIDFYYRKGLDMVIDLDLYSY